LDTVASAVQRKDLRRPPAAQLARWSIHKNIDRVQSELEQRGAAEGKIIVTLTGRLFEVM
jgi:hypothetical protein